MIHENNDNKKVLPVFFPRFHFRFYSQNLNTNNFNYCCWACPNMKDWKQYICLHSFTGVVEPAYWRHTSVYILEDNRIMSLLTQLFDIPPLCVSKTINCSIEGVCLSVYYIPKARTKLAKQTQISCLIFSEKSECNY